MRSCCKCQKEIYDNIYLMIDNKSWHYNCLTCEKCYDRLANTANTCFFKNGMVLCKNDYIKMKQPFCSGCQQSVNPDAYVHKIPCLPMNNSMNFNEYSNWLIYHTSCFKCFSCQNSLKKGDKYILKPDQMGIVCLNNECTNDFRISPISSINQPNQPTRKRGRASNTVKVKNEKAQNQYNQM